MVQKNKKVTGVCDYKTICRYDFLKGMWCSIVLMLFLVAACSPRISHYNAEANTGFYTTVVNKEVGVVKLFSGDYSMYETSEVDYSLLPIKKSNIKKIFSSARTVVPEYYGFILFTSKKVDFSYLTYSDIEEYTYPKANHYIIKEKTLADGDILFSLYYCLENCVDDGISSLKREVFSHHELIKKNCQSYDDFMSTASGETAMYRNLGFFKLLEELKDSLNFCESIHSQYLTSVARSYTGLVQDIQPWKVNLDLNLLYDVLDDYDIVLVKDDHVGYWEDIVFANLIKKRSDFFDGLFIETLNATDSINERKHLLLSSGFYFQGHWQKELVSSAIGSNLKLHPYDAREPGCGIEVECNQRREVNQSKNILENIDDFNRVLVFSGGAHSNLACPEEYQYMGCVMCDDSNGKKVASVVVKKNSISIYSCSGLEQNIPISFGIKNVIPNYKIETDDPSIIALYHTEEYDKYGFQDMPEYIYYTEEKGRAEQIEAGTYYEIEFSLLGNVRQERRLEIK